MKKVSMVLVCLAVFCTLGCAVGAEQSNRDENARTSSDQNAQGADKAKAAKGERGAEHRAGTETGAARRAADRAEAAAKILSETFSSVPNEILGAAKCVTVLPGMTKAVSVNGTRYGRGFATCRTSTGWSAPAPVLLGGGSYGLQIGAEGVDFILVVMNEKGVQHLLSSKFVIGVDASDAAGPIGRSASAAANGKLNSEILSYSRAKGLFAGVELNGATVSHDDDTTKALYGRVVPFTEILSGQVRTPAAAGPFVAEVQKDFR